MVLSELAQWILWRRLQYLTQSADDRYSGLIIYPSNRVDAVLQEMTEKLSVGLFTSSFPDFTSHADNVCSSMGISIWATTPLTFHEIFLKISPSMSKIYPMYKSQSVMPSV